MERNICTQAIVLKTRKVGENHRNLVLLSADYGIIEIRAFHARNSKRAPKAFQFQRANFFLYYNPIKDEYVLKDIQLIDDHQKLREDYNSIIEASIMSELILKTGCEDMERVYTLFSKCLNFFEDDSIENNLIVIQFILRIIKEHGLFDEGEHCPICNRKYNEKEILRFTTTLNSPCCENCANLLDMILPPGARKYLNTTLSISLEQALSYKLNEITSKRIKGYMIRWGSHIIGQPLKSVALLN